MGLLDGIIKGAIGAGVFQMASKLINEQGGIEGIVKKFQNGGLADIANSWVGTGANQEVHPEQVQQTLGLEQLSQLAQQAGIPVEQLSAGLAKVLPQVVDKLTPAGQITADVAGKALTAEEIEQVVQQAS